jgi:23S rRNA pseudouridine955/2504/2580 synthase
MKKIIVNINDIDQRIDNFLKKSFPQLSMPMIYKYLRTKRIKVNEKNVNFDYRLILSDVISLYINDELLSKKNRSSDFKLASNEINVVYEDDNILIVNKPVGLSVHDDDTSNDDTLINRVLRYLSNKNE